MTVKKTRQAREPKESDLEAGLTGLGGLGGLFKGLGGLVEKLAELAQKGEELKRTGEFHGATESKEWKGVYGFSVKVGLGGEGLKVEPFGTIHNEKAAGQAEVLEVCEPMVDVFEEKDYVLLLAEMPGISGEDIHLDLKEDILTLWAEKGAKRYRKEILLPGVFSRDQITISCNNGIAEIRCQKQE